MTKHDSARLCVDPKREGVHASLLAKLSEKNGELLTGEALYTALGYASADAFRKARDRDQLQVGVFSIPNRRGVFALTHEVVDWICELRFDGLPETNEEPPMD